MQDRSDNSPCWSILRKIIFRKAVGQSARAACISRERIFNLRHLRQGFVLEKNPLSKCAGFRKNHTKPHTDKQNYTKTSQIKIPNGNFRIHIKSCNFDDYAASSNGRLQQQKSSASSLVRMRSPVRIWSAAPKETNKPQKACLSLFNPQIVQ